MKRPEKESHQAKDKFNSVCAYSKAQDKYIDYLESIVGIKTLKNKPKKCVVCQSNKIRTDFVFLCESCTCFYDQNGNQI